MVSPPPSATSIRKSRRLRRPRPPWSEERSQNSDPDNNPKDSGNSLRVFPVLRRSLTHPPLADEATARWLLSEPLTLYQSPDNSNTDLNNGEPIVAYNCLLIPVFFAVWWYWTRRAAECCVKRGLLTSQQFQVAASGCTSIHRSALNGVATSTATCGGRPGRSCHDDDDDEPCKYTLEIGDSMSHHSKSSSTSSSSTSSSRRLDGCRFWEMPPQPPPVIPRTRDEFETWEDVVQNSSNDESHAQVRWIRSSRSATIERGKENMATNNVQDLE